MDKPRHLHTLKDAKETVANSRSLSNLKTNSPNQQRKPSNNLQLTQSPRVNSTFIQQSHSPQPVRSSSGGKLSIRTSTSVSGGLTKLSPTKASPTERISTYRPAELRMQSYIPSKSSVNIGPSTNDVHLEADEDAPPVPKLNTQLYGAESSMALGSPNRQASHSVLNSFQVINVQEVSAVDLDNVVMKTKSQSTTDHDFVQDDTQHGISSMSPRYTKTLKKKGTFNSSSKSTHQSNVSENPADKSINIIHFISMVIFFILVALKSSFVYTGPIQQELGISSICLILVVCFAVHEAWRLIETVDKNSVIMFYISGVSFAVTLITAPSSRWLCLSVWPFLLLSFLLQSNGRNLYRQMIYISIFNSGLYIISLVIICCV